MEGTTGRRGKGDEAVMNGWMDGTKWNWGAASRSTWQHPSVCYEECGWGGWRILDMVGRRDACRAHA